MEQTILSAFYWILPAYCANMCPVIFAKLGWLKQLDRPIDGGRRLGNQALFGEHKTWRGLAAGTIGAVIICGLQALFYQQLWLRDLALFDYSSHWLPVGMLMGSGAIIGDLIKSFFKRRIGIVSGGAWPVFDQLDFVVGAFAFASLVTWPGWQIFTIACLLTLILHPLTNLLGFVFGFKKVWW